MSTVAFDAYAKTYDEHFTTSTIGKMQRRRVRNYFNRFISGTKNILEVNCGTGEDAVWLASSGHTVLATDVSAHMLEVAAEKRNLFHIDNLAFQCCSFRELPKLQQRKFDLIFSNFGGLNCVSRYELKDVSAAFSSLLNKDGLLFLVIMGRKCSWEKFYFNRKNNPVKAKRRLTNGPVVADLPSGKTETWYYSPAEISEIFNADFKTILHRPVGLFIPPSYLENYFRKKKILLSMLGFLEKLFGNFQSLSNHADHYLILLEKK